MGRERLYLYDTTLRDGQQTQGVQFSTAEKRQIAQALDNLGIDYIDKRNGYIEAVTLEDAKRVAKKLYQPEKLTFAVAGKPAGVVSSN